MNVIILGSSPPVFQAMELDMSNMRSEVDRAKRAKRSVEEEFDAYQRQQRETNTSRKMEEMQTRMLIAERAKDDALVSLQVSHPHPQRLLLNGLPHHKAWYRFNSPVLQHKSASSYEELYSMVQNKMATARLGFELCASATIPKRANMQEGLGGEQYLA